MEKNEPFSPIIIKHSTGHIFKPTPWCSRKQHLKKIKTIIGDGECISRNSTLDNYYSEQYDEGLFNVNNLKQFTWSKCFPMKFSYTEIFNSL